MGKRKGAYFVGYRYTNKQGLDVEIVAYRGRKDIDVRFDLDGAIVTTTGTYIKQQRPLHPTFGKPHVGQQFPCHDGDVVEIVEVLKNSEMRVKWLSDGTEHITNIAVLRQGHNRHPTKSKPEIGTVFPTNNYGGVVVKQFVNATKILVAFEDGSEVVTSWSNLKEGSVRHPTGAVRIGQKFKTNSGWEGEVVAYEGPHDVLIRWQDGSESWNASTNILSGGIKPPMQPSVEGRGFFGVGRFVPRGSKRGEHAPERMYGYWVRMFSRCYNEFELQKPTGRSYEDKEVDQRWWNFHNFAEWGLVQPNWQLPKFELDKDLLIPNNKVYGPEGCCFLPSEVNKFLIEPSDPKFLRGVHIIEPKTPNAAIGYIARCNTEKGREYLGFFPTQEEAHEAYCICKEAYAKRLAEKWKEHIIAAAYHALMSYSVKERV